MYKRHNRIKANSTEQSFPPFDEPGQADIIFMMYIDNYIIYRIKL